MPDDSRIEQLRRRVRADPTSIAFAALAEEYRKEGRFAEAIDVCRVGLQRHPAYLSARVTLGRALISTGDLDAARLELEAVLRVAPENLAAIRGMAEIYARWRDSEEMPEEEPETRPIAVSADIPDPEAPARPFLTLVPQPVSSPEPEPHRHHAAIVRLESFLQAIVEARS